MTLHDIGISTYLNCFSRSTDPTKCGATEESTRQYAKVLVEAEEVEVEACAAEPPAIVCQRHLLLDFVCEMIQSPILTTSYNIYILLLEAVVRVALRTPALFLDAFWDPKCLKVHRGCWPVLRVHHHGLTLMGDQGLHFQPPMAGRLSGQIHRELRSIGKI